MNQDHKDSQGLCCICGLGFDTHNCELYYGPRMEKSNVIVHSNCLLLSTHLPQEGEDTGGINGFLLRDIRAESVKAKNRKCEYCGNTGASVRCKTCKIYFHIQCGIKNECLFEFTGEFNSFCDQCIKLTEFQKYSAKNWMIRLNRNNGCFICDERLGNHYSPVQFLYGPCCSKGFVHRECMQAYALSAGYYLRCIWCRSVDFRKEITKQGIFVPDREARWETKEAYRDLHRGHKQCDMEICNARDRKYESKNWKLINCIMCGAFGAHYPSCIPRRSLDEDLIEETDFKCEICLKVEKKTTARSFRFASSPHENNLFDTSVYVCKHAIEPEKKDMEKEVPNIADENKIFSKNENFFSESIIVIPSSSEEENENSDDEPKSRGQIRKILNEDTKAANDNEMSTDVCEVLIIDSASCEEENKNCNEKSLHEMKDQLIACEETSKITCCDSNTVDENEMLSKTANYIWEPVINISKKVNESSYKEPMNTLLNDCEKTAKTSCEDSNTIDEKEMLSKNDNSFPELKIEIASSNIIETKNSAEESVNQVNKPSIACEEDEKILIENSDTVDDNEMSKDGNLFSKSNLEASLDFNAGFIEDSESGSIYEDQKCAEISIHTDNNNIEMLYPNLTQRFIKNKLKRLASGLRKDITDKTIEETKTKNMIPDTDMYELHEQNTKIAPAPLGDVAVEKKSKTKNSSGCDFHEIDMYELNKQDHNIIGSAKIRIDMNSSRFAHKTVEQIESEDGFFMESDIIERSNDIGQFAAINEFLGDAANIVLSRLS